MNQQLCDPNRLASFVRRELSDAAERELTAHLDECESCGQALEQQVAEAAAWQEASVFLGDRSLQDQEADFSVSQSRDAQIEQVVSQLSPTDDPDSLGRIGGYEVTGVVGSGGMGVVLKAHDHSLDRVVAVKVMAPHLAASGSARQRFAREAKAAAAVLHPNVIAIHGVSNEQALPYLVMPYVRGQSLQKRIDSEGPLPLVDILRIGAQVAAGLAAAHEQGLVHRDIKPGNILMEQGVERVTITDFGLARAVDDASMTRSGVIAGTPQYMSPEQARAEKIDHRSDLFSLGSVLYAMCTGHPPFRAESSFSVLRLITDKQPRPIRQTNPEIPDWMCAIIQKLMAKDADDRFESAQEVAELLEKCVAHVQQPLEFELPMVPEVDTSGAVTTDLSQWAKCVFSSPEHQRSFFGRHVWPFLERGKVRLNNDSIEWTYNSGLHQTIPFSCIEEVAIGRYSRLTHPMRMDYLSIRYRDGDSVHTQLLTPLASWLTPVSTANAAVRRYADRLPQPAVEVADEPSKRRWWFRFVAASMFLWLLAFAGVLILLEWNTGTLRIESEVDDVPIRIIQGKEVVEELTVSKSGDSVRIAAGNYEVEIGGQIDGLAIDDGSVTLQRGGNDIVRIVKVAPVKSALGDWPSERLMKDLQAISPRRKTVNNLTRIVNALHRYHELHGHFPPATILGKDGKGGPPHSWRVELLPLLGHQELYDQYHFDEPWDSKHNQSLLAQMPDVYRSPLDQGDSTNTSYFGVVSDDISKRAAALQKMREQAGSETEALGGGGYGEELQYEQYTPEATVFWKQRGASFIDMLDGTSNCIAVIEAKRDVSWTKPEDIQYSADQPLPKFSGWFEQGGHAAFADGTVKFLANYNDEQTIRNLLTISDGVPTTPLLVRRLRIHGAIAIPDVYSEVNASRKTYRVPDGPLLWLQPEQQSVITEADIVEVAVTPDPNNSNAGEIVSMTLTEEAGKRFFEATTWLSEQDVNGYVLITFDRKFLTAPKVRTPIGNKLTITGNIDAKKLAERIQAAMDEVDPGGASPPVNVNENNSEPIEAVPRPEERFRNVNTKSINLQPAQEKGTPIPDTPTIAEATRQFNLQSAADRRNLFDPPIGELSVQQMRDAFAKTAGKYREIGEHVIAKSLQNIAETGKLPSDAISPVYASGPYGVDEDGKLTQKQIAPVLVLPDGRGGARLVPLRSAELIYNKHGRSSRRYGDSFEESQQEKANNQQGPPFDDVSKNPSSADFETRTTGAPTSRLAPVAEGTESTGESTEAFPKRVRIADLTPEFDGEEIITRFTIDNTVWLNGIVPKGHARSIIMETGEHEGEPPFSVFVIGEVADAMERFGYAPPQSPNRARGLVVEARGKIKVYPAQKDSPDSGPSYHFTIADLTGFKITAHAESAGTEVMIPRTRTGPSEAVERESEYSVEYNQPDAIALSDIGLQHDGKEVTVILKVTKTQLIAGHREGLYPHVRLWHDRMKKPPHLDVIAKGELADALHRFELVAPDGRLPGQTIKASGKIQIYNKDAQNPDYFLNLTEWEKFRILPERSGE